jgi:hypothetical protein
MSAHGIDDSLERAHLRLHEAASAVVVSVPCCARCDEQGRERRAIALSKVDQVPVCVEHTLVGDVRLVDPVALDKLAALLAGGA